MRTAAAYGVSKYAAFFKGAFKSQIVYRLAAVLGLLGSAVLFFIQVSLWKILTSAGIREDIVLKDMIAFVMITQSAHALTRGNFAGELGASIRDGSVVMHFLRPVSYRLYLLSAMMGKNCYGTLVTALPVIAAGSILAGFPLPPSLPNLLVFFVLILLGVFIMFELIYVVGLLAFWTQATWFLSWYVGAGVAFFGGAQVPLWFYPAVLEKVSRFLPFRYISFEAVNYYTGKLPLSAAGRSITAALVWWFLLFGIGSVLWRCARRKMTINGG
jgi:ABC-2 type transport system permease protein